MDAHGVLGHAINYQRKGVLRWALRLIRGQLDPALEWSEGPGLLRLAIDQGWLPGVSLLLSHGAMPRNSLRVRAWDAIDYAQRLVNRCQSNGRSNNIYNFEAVQQLNNAHAVLKFLKKIKRQQVQKQINDEREAQVQFEQAYLHHDWDGLRYAVLNNRNILDSRLGVQPWGRCLRDNRRGLLLALLTTALDGFTAPDGLTPLVGALQARSLTFVDWLLKAGADANQAVRDGRLPLMFALRHRNRRFLDLLIEYGANVNGRSSYSTVLHQAGLLGNPQAVEYLLQAGANPLQLDRRRRGQSVLQRVCRANPMNDGHFKVIQILQRDRNSRDIGEGNVVLPRDIWLNIVEYLMDDPRALGRMDRVCWNMHTLVQYARRICLRDFVYRILLPIKEIEKFESFKEG